MEGIGKNDDVDYDAARMIMANLNIQKVSLPLSE
jgi:hypothetical protein